MKRIQWKSFLGCQGWFTTEGHLQLHPNLRPKIIPNYHGPIFTLISEKGSYVYLTNNGWNVSRFPKKLTKIYNVESL